MRRAARPLAGALLALGLAAAGAAGAAEPESLPLPPPAKAEVLADPAEAEPPEPEAPALEATEGEATEGEAGAAESPGRARAGDGEPDWPIAEPAVLDAERPDFDPAEAERCEAELRRLGADFTPHGPIAEAGCGAERPLALHALPGGVAVEGPEVLLRCGLALELARWVEQVVQPSARLHLGTTVDSLVASTSYFCRGQAGSGTPSQHAFANALDLLGLRFSDESVMLIAARPDSPDPVRAFQAAIRGGACAYFSTVLGPTTDDAHADHLHLDDKRRSGGYRLCQ